jgi:methylase of polypeptide subunit release factors
MKQGERADYGIDAPYVIRNLAVSGVVCVLIALAAPSLRWFFSPAISLLATAAVWYYNSKFGKLRLREKLIDTLTWDGNETVLDVGCGSGLLLIAVAKRLTNGMAVGVDIWRQEDLSNNQWGTTLKNARIEGVAERVKVEEGDARQLRFSDATFDVVVSRQQAFV